MKKKNYTKLKISNNKIILKEEGTKYGQLGVSAASNLGKMAVDALKMVKTTLKRAWGSTFLYGYNIATSMFKDGIKGLHSANQQFHRDDALLKREQMQLIASQPGNKDAKLFLGMACPAALAFDKYCDTDLSILRKATVKSARDAKDITDKYYGKEKDTYEARVTYINLVTIISHLSDKTPLNIVEVKYSRKNDEVPLLKSVKNNINKDRFRAMSKYLQKFYKNKQQEEDEDDNKKSRKEDTFHIGSDMKEVLEMIYKKVSDKKIILHITKKRISGPIERMSKKFVNNKERKNKIKLEFEEFIKDAIIESFSTKLFIKNKKLILELKDSEKLFKEDNKQQTKNKIDAKNGMMLSFAEYYLLGIDVLMLLVEIQMKKSSAMIVTNEKLLEALSKKEEFDNNLESLITEKITEINSLVNKLGERLPLLEKFKIKIEKPGIQDIEEFSKNLKENLEMIKKSHEEIKDQSDAVKDFTYSQIMLDIVKNVKPEIGNINPANLKDSVSGVVESINKFSSEIDENFKKVCEKNSNVLLKNKINYSEITGKKEEFLSKFSSVYKNLENSYNNIENFTNKESELESFIKEKQDEFENQEGEEEASPEDSKVSESDFIKSELVKIMDSQ